MSVATRAALLEAAGTLFARHGIETPSLREITRAAGQRNTNALQYHFGDRDALLRSLLEEHGEVVDEARRAALALLPADAPLRIAATALVDPLVAQLSSAAGGRDFLQIAGEVVARPVRFAAVLDSVTARPSLVQWGDRVEPFMPAGAVGRPLHRRFAAIRFVHTELASRARERDSKADHRLFVSHLVDLVAGLLAAPVSRETRSLIRSNGA